MAKKAEEKNIGEGLFRHMFLVVITSTLIDWGIVSSILGLLYFSPIWHIDFIVSLVVLSGGIFWGLRLRRCGN